jgi:hypothetical protein
MSTRTETDDDLRKKMLDRHAADMAELEAKLKHARDEGDNAQCEAIEHRIALQQEVHAEDARILERYFREHPREE